MYPAVSIMRFVDRHKLRIDRVFSVHRSKGLIHSCREKTRKTEAWHRHPADGPRATGGTPVPQGRRCHLCNNARIGG